MTANEIFNKALILLGYTDSEGRLIGSQGIKARAVTVINAVYADLYYIFNTAGFKAIKKLSDEIDLPERVLNEIMPYGAAAFLAGSESDGENQQLYIRIYNEKRKSLAKIQTVADAVPSPV